MRHIVFVTSMLAFSGVAFAADDEPFTAEVLKKAFELSKTCTKECKNDSVVMERLPLPQGKVGFLIMTTDMGFCGSGGCSSMVVVVSGNAFQKVTEGLGITRNQAISFISGDSDPNALASGRASFDCTKATSASARLICGDPELSKADGLLGVKFKAVADVDQVTRKRMLEEQVGWIRARNIRCGVGPDKAKQPIDQLRAAKPCMLEAIKARVVELEAQERPQNSSGVVEHGVSDVTQVGGRSVTLAEAAGLPRPKRTISLHDYGADKLPRDAIEVLASTIESLSCFRGRLGEHTLEIDQQTGRPRMSVQNEEQRLIVGFEQAGLVAITLKEPWGPWKSKFIVSLKQPIDGLLLKRQGDILVVCPTDHSKVTGKVTKLDEMKGGRTGWKASIAYIQLTGFVCHKTPTERPVFCNEASSQSARLARALFKQKPFGDGWTFMAYDIYANEKFLTDRVPNALLQD